eukprot:CAMPEP_0184401728 /NCGR_PEP_ID=MMETSP0007-20130409/80109_1 /TAXON_ID=97485 /ORGANISM="Prymnesium parvum, Strain Texoma1" /LENGTH=33 /DNA_ID= /DNA_START= /DNA_END= /DNA_ORIENTATION=
MTTAQLVARQAVVVSSLTLIGVLHDLRVWSGGH